MSNKITDEEILADVLMGGVRLTQLSAESPLHFRCPGCGSGYPCARNAIAPADAEELIVCTWCKREYTVLLPPRVGVRS